MPRDATPEVAPELLTAIRHNCDLSDARFAGNYTMCIYLLKMRELYRWHHGIGFDQSLDMSEVGDWVQATEQRWGDLEDAEYLPLPVDGVLLDSFDDVSVNRSLASRRLVAGSGIGRFGKPLFFLAECLERRDRDGLTVYVTGRELARELAAPPAMIRENRVFLRRESLERTLRETIEEWRWQKRPGAMQEALARYRFDDDEAAAMALLIDDQLEQLYLHEKGEHCAGLDLGERWNERLAESSGDADENLMRAVRDWMADCRCVLPGLLGAGREAPIHFYFALLTPLRRELFPSLVSAYRTWRSDGDPVPLAELAEAGIAHWRDVAIHLRDTDRDRDVAGVISRCAL